jgi:hypothetical protein
MSELCVEPLWCREQPNAIAMQLDICHIFLFKNKFKTSNVLLNSVKYTIKEKEFVSIPKILAWTKQQRWTQCNHHEQSCGVCSS